jgi:hypothetical protein
MGLNIFMINYNSIYKKHCDTTINWLPSDTEELYNKNLIEQRDLLIKNNWIDRKISYTFNSEGFRSDRFTNNPTVMFLGCSNTIGIGLPVEAIWPTLVAKQLNMSCANLGQGGGSADTAFRLCLGWIDKIKPKLVIFLQPPGTRWELLTNRKIEFLGTGFPVLAYEPYMKEWWADDNNHHFNTEKNTLAIQQLCEQRNIKFNKFSGLPFHNQGDLARDLQHAGVKTHQLLSDQICNKI